MTTRTGAATRTELCASLKPSWKPITARSAKSGLEEIIAPSESNPVMKAYEEIVEFMAAGPSVGNVANFQASAPVQERVELLIRKEKTEGLSPEEKMELDDFMQLEHLMRLVKARARRNLSHG